MSYNHDIVAQWIMNDEGLYNLARTCKRARTLDLAARRFIAAIAPEGTLCNPKTPDGVIYSIAAVKAALRDL